MVPFWARHQAFFVVVQDGDWNHHPISHDEYPTFLLYPLQLVFLYFQAQKKKNENHKKIRITPNLFSHTE